jgi:phage terminase large subunit-like protein
VTRPGAAFVECTTSRPPPRDGNRKPCDRCDRRGRHFCAPRAAHVVGFIEECCVHTKSRWARRPFVLTDFQRVEIVEPVFGWVEWSAEWDQWVRVYRVVWISAGRKNGKSELLAALALYLLLADGEQGAELIGCAGTRRQAGKVFAVAQRMIQLSPALSELLASGEISITKHDGARIAHVPTGSWYEVISADADNALGENIHGCLFDEVATQPSDALWHAVRTSMGTRPQAMLIAATTAGDRTHGFASREAAYCRRVAADPTLDRRRYVWIRQATATAELNDPDAWAAANPALGHFLSPAALADEAAEAMIDPAKAKAFRQYRLNTWQRPESRWLPAGRWRTGAPVENGGLTGRRAHGGVDLAAVSDLTSLCWFFPPPDDESAAAVIWRHYVPAAAVGRLDEITAGAFSQWAAGGWVTVTPGEVVDYGPLRVDIAAGYRDYALVDLGIDRWNSSETVTWAATNLPRLDVSLVSQSFVGQSAALKAIDRLLRERRLDVGADPVAAWCASCAEVVQDRAENLKLTKPDRARAAARIDAVAALANAVDGWLRTPAPKKRGRAVGF